jgi:hypothetical protein
MSALDLFILRLIHERDAIRNAIASDRSEPGKEPGAVDEALDLFLPTCGTATWRKLLSDSLAEAARANLYPILAPLLTTAGESHASLLDAAADGDCSRVTGRHAEALNALAVHRAAVDCSTTAGEPVPAIVPKQIKGNPPAPRLVVDLSRSTLCLDGKAYDVASARALRWVRVLADNAGLWISGRDLTTYDPELQNVRTDHLKKNLPSAVAKLIKSENGRGSRIRL